MERFNLKKLCDLKSKNGVRLKSQIGLQLLKTWMMMSMTIVWTSMRQRESML
jgi:hypothetical protein